MHVHEYFAGFKEQEIERSKIVAVNRRGGGGGGHSVGHGGGGHGVGGGEGGHGGHNGGDRTPVGGGAVIPLYAAGGASGSMHRNDNQHHGSRNAAISLCIHLWWLTAAASLVFMFM